MRCTRNVGGTFYFDFNFCFDSEVNFDVYFRASLNDGMNLAGTRGDDGGDAPKPLTKENPLRWERGHDMYDEGFRAHVDHDLLLRGHLGEARHQSENREAIGGMRNPAQSNVRGHAKGGPEVAKTITGLLRRFPHVKKMLLDPLGAPMEKSKKVD